MIIVYCNVCNEEIPEEKDFVFQAIKREIITDFTTGHKKIDEDNKISICKKCYDEHIAKLIYAKKDK